MRYWIILMVLGAVVSSARAAPANGQFRAGNWAGAPQFNAQTKAFERCTATSTSNNTTISYSLDSQFRWDLSLASPAWNFSSGTVWNVFLKAGETSGTIPARAVSAAPSVLNIKVAEPLDLIAILSSARVLRMVAGAAQFEFAVGGTGEALAGLTRCVLQADRPAASRSRKPSPDPLSAAVNAATREEAAALVTSIGHYGGAGDAKVITGADEFARLPVQVAWKAGLVTAAMMVLDAPVNVGGAANVLLGHWQQACRGDLAFVSFPGTIGPAPITRVFTSCAAAETVIAMHQLVIERPKGGTYVISILRPGSVFSDNLQKMADDYEQQLRRTILIAVNKLP